MARQILLVRHAKSSWEQAGVSDHDRPLNERGRRVAGLLGPWMAREGLVPDFVWCSTAERAHRTLELCLPAWTPAPVICLDDQLYLATSAMIWRFLVRTPESVGRVMVVGHNPGMENLMRQMAGVDGDFPTAAVALFELDEDVRFSELEGAEVNFRGIWTPRALFPG